MELLFFIFIAFILLAIILSGSGETKETIKKDYTENFKMYFYSLPEKSQNCFMNSLDYIHRLEFEDYMKIENTAIPEFFIKEFNNWIQNEDMRIDSFDLNNYSQPNPITYDDNSLNDCNFINENIDTNSDNINDYNTNSDKSSNDSNHLN
jgi:hypothetical protein